MRSHALTIAGLTALLATLTAPEVRAQAINAVNSTVNTTNVTITVTNPSTFGPSGVVAVPVVPVPAWVPAPASRAASFWDHNSSVVALEASGNRRRFVYHHPRRGMAEAGARPGSLLFEGARMRDSYSGTAYVFAGRCGRYDYPVSGIVQNDRRVVMNGLAPRIDPRDCSLIGHRPDVLVFDLM